MNWYTLEITSAKFGLRNLYVYADSKDGAISLVHKNFQFQNVNIVASYPTSEGQILLLNEFPSMYLTLKKE